MRENSTYAELNRFNGFIIYGFDRVRLYIARQLEKDRLHFAIIDTRESNVLKTLSLKKKLMLVGIIGANPTPYFELLEETCRCYRWGVRD
ncbi:MAG: hypothetical protein Q7T40_01665 [Methylobacter sp.]|nr:hypothetical protein [Methylobacter sp.]